MQLVCHFSGALCGLNEKGPREELAGTSLLVAAVLLPFEEPIIHDSLLGFRWVVVA